MDFKMARVKKTKRYIRDFPNRGYGLGRKPTEMGNRLILLDAETEQAD